jgi:hypothetical protein
VNLTVASVTSFLASNLTESEGIFTGLASTSELVHPPGGLKRPAIETDDTAQRNYIWSADELGDEDAEGEDDPNYFSTSSRYLTPHRPSVTEFYISFLLQPAYSASFNRILTGKSGALLRGQLYISSSEGR